MQWVIKIGGSLYDSSYLVDWLHAISECESQKIIIVPGGGPFADLIREVDNHFNIDQCLAHNMAILAMQQYGYLMKSLCPSLTLVDTQKKMNACWSNRNVAIWEPFNMVRLYCDLEKSWNITSDSLAAWLAKYLSADQLLFIKSADITLTKCTLENLSKESFIDPYLPEYLAKMNLSTHFMHKTHLHKFKQLLSLC